jgi:hypothetical protein
MTISSNVLSAGGTTDGIDLVSDQTITSGIKTFVEFPQIEGFKDWFLPSQNELIEMYEELHAYAIGGFSSVVYWSSTENNATTAKNVDFPDGTPNYGTKGTVAPYRAARAFTSTTVYAVRDVGPTGGWI